MFASRFWLALLFPTVLMVLFARVSPCEKHQQVGAHKPAASRLPAQAPAPAAIVQTSCPNNWTPVTCCVPPEQQVPTLPPAPQHAASPGVGQNHGNLGHQRQERSQQQVACVEQHVPAETTFEYTCKVSTPATAPYSHHSYGASVPQTPAKNPDDKPPTEDSSNTHKAGAHHHGDVAAAAPPAAASSDESNSSETDANAASSPTSAAATIGPIMMAIFACIFA